MSTKPGELHSKGNRQRNVPATASSRQPATCIDRCNVSAATARGVDSQSLPTRCDRDIVSGRNVNPYKHTQVGTVFIVVLALVLLVMLMVTPLPTWLVPLYAVLVLLFGWLTVEINEESLVCRFGIGLIRKRFALRDIEEARTVRNRRYYGWGIRWTPHGWLFNAAGLDAIEIKMSNEKSYRIGTDQPAELLRAIQQSTRLSA